MSTTQQPEALRLTDELDAEAGRITQYTNRPGDLLRELAADELRRQHARIAELEAQLASIGAGGVSGPLIGRAFDAADMATAKAEGFREGAAEMAKLGEYETPREAIDAARAAQQEGK